jgi:hypothetical protein
VKGDKMILQVNRILKQTRVAILVSDKQASSQNYSDIKRSLQIIKVTTHQENIIMVITYAANFCAPNNIKHHH